MSYEDKRFYCMQVMQLEKKNIQFNFFFFTHSIGFCTAGLLLSPRIQGTLGVYSKLISPFKILRILAEI